MKLEDLIAKAKLAESKHTDCSNKGGHFSVDHVSQITGRIDSKVCVRCGIRADTNVPCGTLPKPISSHNRD